MRAFILFMSLFLCQGIHAATYYISPSGNDTTGDGSLTLPWASLHKATTQVITAGDTIRVLPGVYYETEECFLAVGVNILGSGIGSSFINSQYSNYFATFLTLSSPDGTIGNQFISGLSIDGGYVNDSVFKTWVAIWVTGRGYVNINNCHITNFKNRGVIFDGNHATEPRQDTNVYAFNNRFEYNTVLNSAENNGAYGAGLLNIGGQAGMFIHNNNLVQNQRDSFANGWPIKYWDNGWLRGVNINNNTLIKSPFLGSYPGQGGDWDFAIELFNIQGLEVFNNYIEGSIDLNYNYMGNYDYCAWIHNNTFNHSVLNGRTESGIIFEYRTESALVERNIFRNISGGVIFNTRSYHDPGGNDTMAVTPPGGYSYLTDIVIRNNLFTNIYQGNGAAAGGGVIFHSESSNDTQINGLNIDYNTIVAQEGDEPWFGIALLSLQNGMANNVNIRNNIVNGFLETWLRGDSSVTNINGITVTHNNAFDNGFGNGNAPSWPGGNPQNYTYSNNLSVDPQFISPTVHHLQPLSPLYGAGTSIPGVNNDILYNGRNYQPTIGAYEDNLLFSAKLFLQGAYSASLGRHKDVTPAWAAILNAHATMQPYGPIYGYNGLDSVPAGFFTDTNANGIASDIIDWVLLELRSTANPATVINQRAALIREDGLIVDTDGVSPVAFKGAQAGNYLVSIRHRNHLGVRTSVVQSLNGTMAAPVVYDFTTAQSSAYQDSVVLSSPPPNNNNAMLALPGGKFGLWGGNSNSNTTVRANGPLAQNDYLHLITSTLGGNITIQLPNVYSSADMNMDGTVRANGPLLLNDYLFLVTTTLAGNITRIITQHL